MPKTQARDRTVSQAATKIYGQKTHGTVKAVQWLIQAETFPGAHKVDPSVNNSPYFIPGVEVEAFIATNKKRGQSEKD